MINRAVSAPPTIVHSTPGPASTTGSALSPSKSAEPVAKPLTRRPTLPTPAPDRWIRRQGAFYHIAGEEEAPWKKPGGCNPRPDGTHPTRGRPTPGRPASRSPPSIHPPVSHPRVSDSHGEGNHLPSRNLLSPFRLPTPQGSQPSQPSHSLPAPPLPQADGTPTLPLREIGAITPTFPTQLVSTSRTSPLFGEGPLVEMSWFLPPLFRALGSGPLQLPPCFPMTAPTTPVAPNPSPKRKREDTGDALDGDEASDKKRSRRPPSDDVD